MLPEHPTAVRALAYSGSGELCASGGKDGVITLFNTRTRTAVAKLEGHRVLQIKQLAFLKNDTELLSTSFDAKPDGAGFQGEYILWSLAGSGKVLRRATYSYARGLGNPIFAPAPEGYRLYLIDRGATKPRLVSVDLETGKETEVLIDGEIRLIASTRRGDRLAVLGRSADPNESSYLEVLDVVGTSKVQPIVKLAYEHYAHDAAFSPDGKTLALSAGWLENDRRVEIREVSSLRLLRSFKLSELALDIQFDGQGKRLAFLENYTIFRAFDLQRGEALGAFKSPLATASAFAFRPDGEEIALGAPSGSIRTARGPIINSENILPGPPPKSEAWCVAFLSDGGSIAVGYDHEDGQEHDTLRLLGLNNQKAKSLAGHDSTVMALAIGRDGRILATAGYDGTVRLWEAATGRLQHVLKGHSAPVRALALSPDGARVVSAGSDLSVKVWRVSDATLERTWHAHDSLIRSVAFSRDGGLLLTAAQDLTIKMWNPGDGRLIRTVNAGASVQGIACSPDGTLLASADEGNLVQLWQLPTGTLVKTLSGHSAKVRCVAFSPDGKTLASGGEDKVVRLWNVVAGQELLEFPVEDFVNGLAFDVRGGVLAAALHNGTVRVWLGD
jgi:WD40 repeat protein